MIHRHLNHQELTLAAIDDVIARGKRRDWEELRLAILDNPVFLEKIRRVCRAHVSDPRAQRYHFWMYLVSGWKRGLIASALGLVRMWVCECWQDD
jgi:hypothetical protein